MHNFDSVGSSLTLLQSVGATGSRGSALGGGIVIGISGLVLGLLGILFVFLSFRIRRVGSNLRHHGMRVDGVLSNRGMGTYAYTGPRSGGGRYYHISYRYDCEGKTYSHTQNVSKRYYTALAEGDTMPVLCLANDPTVARAVDPHGGRIIPDVGKGEGRATPFVYAVLGVFLLVMALVMAGVALSVILNG
ncbi:MAG TPA: DUF3592 domain-containing protein [Ktedonobacteraceae bacterium]